MSIWRRYDVITAEGQKLKDQISLSYDFVAALGLKLMMKKVLNYFVI